MWQVPLESVHSSGELLLLLQKPQDTAPLRPSILALEDLEQFSKCALGTRLGVSETFQGPQT